jgi:hypothetical protein
MSRDGRRDKQIGRKQEQTRETKGIFVERITANISKYLVIPTRVLSIASISVVYVWNF